MPELITKIDEKTAANHSSTDLIAESRRVSNLASKIITSILDVETTMPIRESSVVLPENEKFPGTTLVLEMDEDFGYPAYTEKGQLRTAAQEIFHATNESPLQVNCVRFATYLISYPSPVSEPSNKIDPLALQLMSGCGLTSNDPNLAIALSQAAQTETYIGLGLKTARTLRDSLTPPNKLPFSTHQRVSITTMLDTDVEGLFVLDLPEAGIRMLGKEDLKTLADFTNQTLITFSSVSKSPELFALWLRQGEPEVAAFRRPTLSR